MVVSNRVVIFLKNRTNHISLTLPLLYDMFRCGCEVDIPYPAAVCRMRLPFRLDAEVWTKLERRSGPPKRGWCQVDSNGVKRQIQIYHAEVHRKVALQQPQHQRSN